MKRHENIIERSFSMMIASYYLARCGDRVENESANPPKALEASTWNAAYDLFFDAMGDGRTPSQFRNSIKNARDTFDTLFDNGRIGWIDRDGQQPSLSASFRRIHDEWKDRSDKELEDFVLGLQSGMPNTTGDRDLSVFARTEGGEKVYVSVRRERDPMLREQAIQIHGSDCMACGFNFERAYGSVGKGFIEVHHSTPLSEAGLTLTDARTDLVVLCANCHRVVHRRRGMCLSLDELREHIKVASAM